MLGSAAHFGGSFASSTVLTGLTILLARRKGWLFYPREERWHKTPVAKFGGVPLLLCFGVFGMVIPAEGPLRWVALLTAAMSLVGFCDDVWVLRPSLKFGAQVLISAAAIYSGVVYPLTYVPVINYAFTLLWLVGLTNALNLLDNMDGLSAGVGVIALVNLAIVLRPSEATVHMMAVMAGALLGFLVFNFNPAKIFMGDTGSLAVGFFLACASTLGARNLSSTISVLFIPGLMLFIPIFDVALVSITRRLHGRAISAGAKDHSSHRLVTLGLSERGAVLTLYTLSIASGLVAYLWKHVWTNAGPGLLLLFLVTAGLFWLYLAKVRLPDDWLSRTTVFTFALPELLNSIAAAAGMIFVDAGLIVFSLWLSFFLRFSGIPEQTLSAFFLSAALAIAFKIPALAMFGTYQRGWAVRSMSDMYPIIKASAVSMLCLVTALTYSIRFREASRTVFLMDCVLTVALLSFARVSTRVFDDMLPRNRKTGYVVFGGPSAEFFAHYFEWQHPRERVLAIASDQLPSKFIGAIRVVSTADGMKLVGNGSAHSLFLLPDCDTEVRQQVIRDAALTGIAVNEFQLSLLPVSAEAAAAAGSVLS
jgi:UDP-GlcNAc:undecaprenyl-phosphate/decaprenyl-phosphate GlcNAc-1-phosphate transferase